MTRAEQAVDTLTHSTKMTIGLFITVGGILFATGAAWQSTRQQEITNAKQDSLIAKNTEGFQTLARAMERLTTLQEQQAEIIRELRSEVKRP